MSDEAKENERQAQLALVLLTYFTQTYGKTVWVLDYYDTGVGRLAWLMDFSSTLHHPAHAEVLPEHERPWFMAAAWRDVYAVAAMDRGTEYTVFINKDWVPVNNLYPKVLL